MAGAVNLLVQRHPINSALSLVVVMGSLAVEYLLLGAEFVAAVQVIVYAGAIMVLFVFVIMLLNAGDEERTQGQPGRTAVRNSRNARRQRAGGLGLAAAFGNGSGRARRAAGRSERRSAGCCFTNFLLPFEVTSILILIAIMGAVVLASKPRSGGDPGRKES